MTAATTDFLWTSNPLTYSRTVSNWLLPPSRTWSDVGRTVLFEESLQRAPASRHGNNSRSLSVRQPMLPHELVASVSARATSAPDHQKANLGPTGTSPTASPRTPLWRPARDFHARKVPGGAFRPPGQSGEYPAKPGEGGLSPAQSGEYPTKPGEGGLSPAQSGEYPAKPGEGGLSPAQSGEYPAKPG